MLVPLDVDVPLRYQISLPVELRVQLSILSLPLVVCVSLFVHLCSEGLDETDIAIYSGFVVLIHAALVLVQSTEILLQIQKLVLQAVVVSLLCSQLGCLGHKLGDKSLLLAGSNIAAGLVLLHAQRDTFILSLLIGLGFRLLIKGLLLLVLEVVGCVLGISCTRCDGAVGPEAGLVGSILGLLLCVLIIWGSGSSRSLVVLHLCSC